MISKGEANYRPAGPDPWCRECFYYTPSAERCSQVSGTIKPNATCDLWEASEHISAEDRLWNAIVARDSERSRSYGEVPNSKDFSQRYD